MPPKTLVAIPVYNEAAHVRTVLQSVREYADHILVVNDGSTDGTSPLLTEIEGIHVVHHPENRGYGAALVTAFEYAARHQFDVLVTMDCDGQHQPRLISQIAAGIDLSHDSCDMVSGSRYLEEFPENTPAPPERRQINRKITTCLKQELGLDITDAFCGFKAYRVDALRDLDITIPGYAMPLQLWVQIVDLNWRITEFAVPRVYTEEARSFGGALDVADERLAHYRSVLNAELERRGMSQRFTADCGQP